MPGAVGRTSTQALCHATQSYVLTLAGGDLDRLLRTDPSFATALNLCDGTITHPAVAAAHGFPAGIQVLPAA